MNEDRLPSLSTVLRMIKADSNFKTLKDIDPTYVELSLTTIKDGVTDE